MRKLLVSAVVALMAVIFAAAPMASAATGPGAPTLALTTGNCSYIVYGRHIVNYPHPPAASFTYDATQVVGVPTITSSMPGNYNVYSKTSTTQIYGAYDLTTGTYPLVGYNTIGTETTGNMCANFPNLVVTTSWVSVADGNTYSQTCTYAGKTVATYAWTCQ